MNKNKKVVDMAVVVAILTTDRAVKAKHRSSLEFCEDRGKRFFVVLRFGFEHNFMDAHVAQLVEHILGKDEVISSILIMGSI